MKQGNTSTLVTFGRGKHVTLTLPPRCSYRIEMKLKGKGKDYNQLTDLAIDHKDITIEKGNIQVCLHNVSGKDAPRALVVLTDSSGKVLSQSRSSILAAPNDLNARTTRVQLSCPEGVSLKGCRIVIDPNNEIDEIYENNNQVAL